MGGREKHTQSPPFEVGLPIQPLTRDHRLTDSENGEIILSSGDRLTVVIKEAIEDRLEAGGAVVAIGCKRALPERQNPLSNRGYLPLFSSL